jgi:hypothetical protein
VVVPVTGGNVKVLVLVLGILATIGATVGVWVIGTAAGLRHNYNTRLQRLGLNRQTAALYGRAARLIQRLEQAADLSGAIAGDVLSPETKKLVDDWLADYRKKDR